MNEEFDTKLLDLAKRLQSDVILLNGAITPLSHKQIADTLLYGDRAKRSILVLTTLGGDPDGAFRLASLLQKIYPDGYATFVPSLCKSAGTLIALGSREIIMTITGELGPLDIQIAKEDDLMGRHSGLDMLHGIYGLTEHSFQAFERFFLDILDKSRGSITTRTAAKIATDMVTGLFSQSFNQIDPVRLGMLARANRIGMEYAVRLGAPREAISRLTDGYPTHSFVIDIGEAQELFGDTKPVRPPTKDELEILALLHEAGFDVYHPNPNPLILKVWKAGALTTSAVAEDGAQEGSGENAKVQRPQPRGNTEVLQGSGERKHTEGTESTP